MPITRLATEAGLGPDDIACASSAYEAALKLLNLTDRTDPLTEVVAKKVIEVAQAGEDDAMRICARVLDELGISPPEAAPTEAAPSEAAPPEPDKPRDLDRQAILLELQTLKSGEPMNALPRLRELASEIEQAMLTDRTTAAALTHQAIDYLCDGIALEQNRWQLDRRNLPEINRRLAMAIKRAETWVASKERTLIFRPSDES
jgi:hypothetical protein